MNLGSRWSGLRPSALVRQHLVRCSRPWSEEPFTLVILVRTNKGGVKAPSISPSLGVNRSKGQMEIWRHQSVESWGGSSNSKQHLAFTPFAFLAYVSKAVLPFITPYVTPTGGALLSCFSFFFSPRDHLAPHQPQTPLNQLSRLHWGSDKKPDTETHWPQRGFDFCGILLSSRWLPQVKPDTVGRSLWLCPSREDVMWWRLVGAERCRSLLPREESWRRWRPRLSVATIKNCLNTSVTPHVSASVWTQLGCKRRVSILRVFWNG